MVVACDYRSLALLRVLALHVAFSVPRDKGVMFTIRPPSS